MRSTTPTPCCATTFPDVASRAGAPTWVFTQDGASARAAKETIAFIRAHAPACIRGTGVMAGWPPKSPDLYPPDYSIWGIAGNDVVEMAPKDHTQRRAAAITVCKKNEKKAADGAIAEFTSMLERFVAAGGRHFERKIEKKWGNGKPKNAKRNTLFTNHNASSQPSVGNFPRSALASVRERKGRAVAESAASRLRRRDATARSKLAP